MISLPSYVIRFWKFQDMCPRSTTPLMSFFSDEIWIFPKIGNTVDFDNLQENETDIIAIWCQCEWNQSRWTKETIDLHLAWYNTQLEKIICCTFYFLFTIFWTLQVDSSNVYCPRHQNKTKTKMNKTGIPGTKRKQVSPFYFYCT